MSVKSANPEGFLGQRLASIWAVATWAYVLGWCLWAFVTSLWRPHDWLTNVASRNSMLFMVNPGWCLLFFALVLLPLKRSAGLGGVLALTAARLWVGALWIVAAGYCDLIWGKPSVIIGALLAGGGVFFVAVLASLFTGNFGVLAILALNGFLIWIANGVAVWSMARWSSGQVGDESREQVYGSVSAEDVVRNLMSFVEDPEVDIAACRSFILKEYPHLRYDMVCQALKHATLCLQGYTTPQNFEPHLDEDDLNILDKDEDVQGVQKELIDARAELALAEANVEIHLYRLSQERLREGRYFDRSESRILPHEAAELVFHAGKVLEHASKEDEPLPDEMLDPDSLSYVIDALKVVYICRWDIDGQREMLTNGLNAIMSRQFFKSSPTLPAELTADTDQFDDKRRFAFRRWREVEEDWNLFRESVDGQMHELEDPVASGETDPSHGTQKRAVSVRRKR